MPRTGRPPKADDATHAAMADRILDNPTLTPTAAFRQVFTDFSGEQSREAARKRIVTKFNKHRDALMVAAAERRRRRVVHRNHIGGHAPSYAITSKAIEIASQCAGMGYMVDAVNRAMPSAQQLLADLDRTMSPLSYMLAELDKPTSQAALLLAELDKPTSQASLLLAELGTPTSQTSLLLADLADPTSRVSLLLAHLG